MKTKEQKQKESAQRQAAYDKLTPQQKLDRLNQMVWRAKKQRERLQAQIDEDERKRYGRNFD